MSAQDTPVPTQDTGIAEGFYPLSFGHRFAWTWRFARTAFWYALGLQLLFAIAAGVVAITTILAFGGFTLLAQQHQGALVDPQVLMAAMGPTSMAVVLVAMLVGLLLTAWYQAAFSRLPVLYLQQGRLPRYRNLLREAWSRTPDMGSAMGLVMLLPLLLVGAVYGFLAVTHRLTPLIGGAAAILLVIVLLIIFIALALTGPVVANEPVSPVRALQRAWWLSRGRRGSILWFVLLVSLLYTLLLFAINLVGLLFGIGVGQPGLAGVLFQVVFGILGVALQALYMTALQTGLSVYYLEARVVSEGWTPNWKWSLHPYWPNNGTRPPPIGMRGKKGWIELLLLNVLAIAALWGAVHYLGSKLPLKSQWTITSQQYIGASGPSARPGPSLQPMPASPVEGGSGTSDTVAIRLKIGSFFDMGKAATVWVEPSVALPSLAWPPGAKLKNLLRIEIKDVRGDQGESVYNAESPTETRFFQQVDLSKGDDGRYKGVRQVNLLPGVREGHLAEIQGIVHWRVPSAIQVYALSASNVGKTLEIGGKSVLVKSFSNNGLSLTGEPGYGDAIVGLVGESRSGDRVQPNSTSKFGDQINYSFPDEVTRIKLYVGEEYKTSDLPFVLKPGQPVDLLGDAQATAPAQTLPDPHTTDIGPSKAQEKTNVSFDLSDSSGRDRLRHWLYQEVSAGHCQVSLPWLNSLLAKVPDDAWAHYARAACLRAMGQKKAPNDDAVFACGHGYMKACDLIQ